MKKVRILALLTALVLTLGMVSLASAEGQPRMSLMKTKAAQANRIGYMGDEYYLLKNGKTATFYIPNHSSSVLIEKKEAKWYTDVIFDCDSVVKAKSSAKWVQIVNHKNGFNLGLESNEKITSRTAKITVTGKGYKATIKLIQYGSGVIDSVTRNKNVVTVKFTLAKGVKEGQMDVYYYPEGEDEEGFQTMKSKYISIPEGTTSVKFKVKAGYMYDVHLSDVVYIGNFSWSFSAAWRNFLVDSVKGTDTYQIN